MTKLELQALKEAQKLLSDFQSYKFYDLIHKTKNCEFNERIQNSI